MNLKFEDGVNQGGGGQALPPSFTDALPFHIRALARAA